MDEAENKSSHAGTTPALPINVLLAFGRSAGSSAIIGQRRPAYTRAWQLQLSDLTSTLTSEMNLLN
jgi:hypothetical protein